MIPAFVTSRVDYCTSALHVATTAHVRRTQNVLNAAAQLVFTKRKFDHINADIQDQLH
jgi:hypothetical protein